MKSTWEGILASIFDGFWWILGAKLGGKIEPRGIKNGIEQNDEKLKGNQMAKKSQQEALTTRGAVGPEPWGGGGCPHFEQKVANMAPSWLPKSSKNR